MARLRFYEVNQEYIRLLSAVDDKVPRIDYSGEGRQTKFLCGIVLNVNEHNYFAPVSSFNKQQRSNFVIEDAKGNPIASLRFSYMIPVPLSAVSLKDFSKEESQYRNLLDIEIRYINRNITAIQTRARYVYDSVVAKAEPGMVKNCCNFILLEAACAEYIKAHS